MARSQMQEHIIFRWLSLKSTIEYLGEWEMLYNPDFNCTEFGTIKNAAGIYGILAVLSVFMGPFVKIGIHYLLLKSSAVICSVFDDKQISSLTDSFSSAMSLLLAVIAVGCVLVLISTVCFLKGAG